MSENQAGGTRYIIPGLGKCYERFGDLAWPIVRIFSGLFYIPHGLQKVFGLFGGDATRLAQVFEGRGLSPGMFWVQYVGWLELVGDILLVLGLFTRPVALLFAGFMVGGIYWHQSSGYFWTARGMEIPIFMLAIAVALALRGGGEYSLDRKRGREF